MASPDRASRNLQLSPKSYELGVQIPLPSAARGPPARLVVPGTRWRPTQAAGLPPAARAAAAEPAAGSLGSEPPGRAHRAPPGRLRLAKAMAELAARREELDLLKEKLPAKGFERDAAVRHFHEVSAATSLNAAIFGAPGGALQKQLVASFDSCLTAVGELKARVASLEQSRDNAEKRASAAESRLNDTGKVTLDDLTDLRKSFEAPAQPNNDDLRERCRRAEARADEAVSTIDGLRERLARAEEALSNLRATSDASSSDLKARCDDADAQRADERELRARLDERVSALELSTEATQTRTTNALDDLTREHGFVLEWRARAEEQIRGLQQVDAA